MRNKAVGIACLLVLACSSLSGQTVDYLRDVKPILNERCYSCHGAIRQKAGLRLDTATLIRRGGDSGSAIEPGSSDQSLLIERLTAGAKSPGRMPPPSEGVALGDHEIGILRAWIKNGASAPAEATPADPRRHWAYLPPARSAIPVPGVSGGNSNLIDAFLESAHRAKGLQASPPAKNDLLLRRVYLDLVGLSPTRQETQDFRADHSPGAYEKVVDRLLASPQYGERWGRHWMDVWRYSDWYGLGEEARYSHPHIWQWRDWIIASLNADKGYDRMIVEMLAADELTPDDPAAVRATGFLVRNWDIFNRNTWLANTVEHTARAFLGVTIQCARCHDHKFDPISQSDYYRLRAFFEPVHIRIDRVPGQPDRAKAGLPRVFDDFLDTPTFLFVRGDETRPDKRPLTPATPAVLGGEARIAPVPLPLVASNPDKRDFVIREAIDAGELTIRGANGAAEQARRTMAQKTQTLTTAIETERQSQEKHQAAGPAPEQSNQARQQAIAAVTALARARREAEDARNELAVAESALTLAGLRQTALEAVLRAERLEDEVARKGWISSSTASDHARQPNSLPAGARATSDSHHTADRETIAILTSPPRAEVGRRPGEGGPTPLTAAAQSAAMAQRKLAVHEAAHESLVAQRALDVARRTVEALTIMGAAAKDPNVQAAIQKASAEVVDASARLAGAGKQLLKAEAAAKEAPATSYTPRPLVFHRAKTSFRDQPSNKPYSAVSTGRRLALARWIVDRRNPLTARVAVNQIWMRHFGEPLVPSTFDFGLRTQRPIHHEMLDWLAVEFMESGWSTKHLHRRIVTSRAYRMQSTGGQADVANARIDPDNHYLWRMNVKRMEAEVIRDTLLNVADRLDTHMGGPDLALKAAETIQRRSIYYRYARGDRIPFLVMFDAPSVEECYRRDETIVPQQALALINSGEAIARAMEIATVIDKEIGDSHTANAGAAFVISAFERVLGRAPTVGEQAECIQAIERLRMVFASESQAEPVAHSKARAALVHVLLNHNDFVSIR